MNGMPSEKPQNRIAMLADQCVQCGLCLPVCPTYALDGNETESPRGRIAIAAALATGAAALTDALREPLDHCLGCLNCQRVCPAGVQYEALLVETRALIGPAPGRPTMLLGLIAKPTLITSLARLARLVGLPRWAAFLPMKSGWRAALSLLGPRISSNDESLPELPAQGNGPAVALFSGCVASSEDAQAERAAEILLRAAGYRVHRLAATCCGALDLHDGLNSAAESAATQLRDLAQKTGIDRWATVTPGCLSTLRRALRDIAIDDVYELLADRVDRLRFSPLPQRIALHVPCTQANVARSDAALIRVLANVPALELKRLAPPPYCCGAAGSHVLQFPERANRLRDGMLEHVATLEAQLLLSSNIGCRMHLGAGLAAQASTMRTMHPLTLLAQQWIPEQAAMRKLP